MQPQQPWQNQGQPQTQPTPVSAESAYIPIGPTLPETPPEPSKKEGFNGILSTILILVAAPIVAFILTIYVFQSYEVDGPSMESTLHDQDRLIVSKLPRTWARLTGGDYIPKRNDIIIFSTTSASEGERLGEERQLIKRVIGLPGDRVVVENGILTVFNDENPNGFQPDKTFEYGKVITDTPGRVDVTVGEGEVFVCGDNRPNSLDSRSIGPIDASDIVGKLVFRIYPLGDAGGNF